QQNTERLIQAGLIALGIVVVTPLVLFVLGRLFGYLTLSVARRSGAGNRYLVDILGWLGRMLYRGVIILAILYFYVSLPLLLFGILAVVMGGWYYITLSPGDTVQEMSSAKAPLIVFSALITAAFLPVLIAMFFHPGRRPQRVRYLSRE